MSQDQVVFTLDLSADLADVPSEDRADLLESIGDYLIEAALSDVGEAKSPVTGRQFKKLNPKYAEFKKTVSSSAIANLELYGDMLDALTYKVSGNKIKFGIWGDQAPKADGHNNFSGDSKLPRRPFIPDANRGETFRPGIMSEVENMIEEAVSNGTVD